MILTVLTAIWELTVSSISFHEDVLGCARLWTSMVHYSTVSVAAFGFQCQHARCNVSVWICSDVKRLSALRTVLFHFEAVRIHERVFVLDIIFFYYNVLALFVRFSRKIILNVVLFVLSCWFCVHSFIEWMAGVCLYTIVTSQSQYIALKKENLKGFGGGGRGGGGRMYYVHHRPHQMGLLQQH